MDRSSQEWKLHKSEYDRDYRKRNRARLKVEKAEYFQRVYDPIAAATERKKTMAHHVEYCRQPHYRILKKVYDSEHRYSKNYGEYAEAVWLLWKLQREISRRMTRYEIRRENGTLNKKKQRDRLYFSALAEAVSNHAQGRALANPQRS